MCPQFTRQTPYVIGALEEKRCKTNNSLTDSNPFHFWQAECCHLSVTKVLSEWRGKCVLIWLPTRPLLQTTFIRISLMAAIKNTSLRRIFFFFFSHLTPCHLLATVFSFLFWPKDFSRLFLLLFYYYSYILFPTSTQYLILSLVRREVLVFDKISSSSSLRRATTMSSDDSKKFPAFFFLLSYSNKINSDFFFFCKLCRVFRLPRGWFIYARNRSDKEGKKMIFEEEIWD